MDRETTEYIQSMGLKPARNYEAVLARKARKERLSQQRAERNYEAAAVNRLTYSWQGSYLTADSTLRYQLPRLRARSRELAMNNEYVKRFLALVGQNVVGPNGFTYKNRAKDPGGKFDSYANGIIEEAWREWSRIGSCTLDGELSLRDAENLAIQTVARDGEVLIKRVASPYNNYRFAIQLVECDHLDTEYNKDLSDGNKIRMGIEYNSDGRRVAYWLLTNHPGDQYQSSLKQGKVYERISADEIWHLYLKDRPTQSRGVPWIFASMAKLNNMGAYDQAHIIAARIGAAKMGFFTRTTPGMDYKGEDEDEDGNSITTAEPGTFESLPIGVDFKEFDPDYPQQSYEPFIKAALHGISAGMNVSYSSLSNDLKDVSYSSGRIGLLDERDGWKTLQGWFIEHFCNPIHDSWLMYALLTVLPLPATKYQKYRICAWRGRGWTWIDPQKEIEAAVNGMDNYLTTLQDQLAERGLDLEDVLQQRAYEIQRMKELGLPVPSNKNKKPGGADDTGQQN